jgi:hypothetical protein
MVIRLSALMLLTAWLAAPAARAEEEAPIGFVKTVLGQAEIRHADLDWPLRPGTPVYEGDVVTTGADGAFGITLKDDTRISGGPNTRLEVKAFTYRPVQGELESIIELLRGSILYISGTIARLAPDAAKVETPRGTIAVRGTRFLLRIDEDR